MNNKSSITKGDRMKNGLFIAVGLTSTLLFASCSSMPKPGIESAGQEKVLSRINDLGSRPKWVKEDQPFRVEDGQAVSLGQTTISADDRLEAAYRIADNNAKAAIATAIEQRLEFLFQNAEEGTAIDATQARYIGAESSKLVTNSLRLQNRYWEKVMVIGSDGRPNVLYRIFSSVVMPEQDFKMAIMDAIRKGKNRKGLSQSFAEKVDKQWDQFVNAEIQPTQESAHVTASSERKPASTEANTEKKPAEKKK